MFLRQQQHFVENLKGETRSLDKECESRLLYIRNCSDSRFQVAGSPLKIVLDNCENVQILLSCRHVLTGTLEAVRCKGLVLGLPQKESIVPTLTLDMCSDVRLMLKARSALRNLISASDCSNINVEIESMVEGAPSQVFSVTPPADIRSQQLRSKASSTLLLEGGSASGESGPSEQEEEERTQVPVQFISRFAAPNRFETEVVVREGCGYPTTLREKNIADEKERRLNDKLEEFLLQHTTIPSRSTSASSTSKAIEQAPSDSNEEVAKTGTRRELFSQINELDVSKLALKPTTTVVRHQAVVTGQQTSQRSFESEEELREYNDTPEELQEKTTKVAELLKESRHTVVFTGAGVSTAASIPGSNRSINLSISHHHHSVTNLEYESNRLPRPEWSLDIERQGYGTPATGGFGCR